MIKPRVYSKKTKKMYYDVQCIHIDDERNWATVFRNDPIENKKVSLQIQPKDCVITLSTGLKDRNGKEIFIGDIMKYDDDYDKSVFKIIKIKFGTGVFYKSWKDIPENYLSPLDYFHLENAYVIGNIYENTF